MILSWTWIGSRKYVQVGVHQANFRFDFSFRLSILNYRGKPSLIKSEEQKTRCDHLYVFINHYPFIWKRLLP
jgi:hypothetical protein